MSNFHKKRRFYWVLLLPALPTMSFLFFHMNTNLEALRRPHHLHYWPPENDRNLSNYVLPKKSTLLMTPRQLHNGSRIFLLIVVHSRTHSVAARQRIRQTWGNTMDFNYEHFEDQHASMRGRYLEPLPQLLSHYRDYFEESKSVPGKLHLPTRVVFFLGTNWDASRQKTLREEQQRYDDIVQQDFMDTYANLTIKSVMMLKWLKHHSMRYKIAFIMKCDEDVFINVPNLLHFLLGGTIPNYHATMLLHDIRSVNVMASYNRFDSTEKVLLGHIHCNATASFNTFDKFYVPYYMFGEMRYPPYLSGPGYIMSSDVVRPLYRMALSTPLFHLEDIFLTGICAQSLRLQLQHNSLFSYAWSPLYGEHIMSQLCFMKGIVVHHRETVDMKILYNFTKNKHTKCNPPNRNYSVYTLLENPCFPIQR